MKIYAHIDTGIRIVPEDYHIGEINIKVEKEYSRIEVITHTSE